jgi:hypothetical protein
MLVAEHFDTGPIPVLDDAGMPIEGGMVLGTVEVDTLEIDKLTVAGADVSGGDED